jgi:hypothetical protein
MGRGEGGAPELLIFSLSSPVLVFVCLLVFLCLSPGSFLFSFFCSSRDLLPQFLPAFYSFFHFFCSFSFLYPLCLAFSFFFFVFLPQSFLSSSSVSWVFSPSLQPTFDFSVLLCIYRARWVGNGRYAEGRPPLRHP